MRFFIAAAILLSQVTFSSESFVQASIADKILRRRLLRSLQYIEYAIAASDNGRSEAPTIIVG